MVNQTGVGAMLFGRFWIEGVFILVMGLWNGCLWGGGRLMGRWVDYRRVVDAEEVVHL